MEHSIINRSGPYSPPRIRYNSKYSEYGPDSTVSNFPGHGRTMDVFLTAAGRQVERVIGRLQNRGEAPIVVPPNLPNHVPPSLIPSTEQLRLPPPICGEQFVVIPKQEANLKGKPRAQPRHTRNKAPVLSTVVEPPTSLWVNDTIQPFLGHGVPGNHLTPFSLDALENTETKDLISKSNDRCLTVFKVLDAASENPNLQHIGQKMWSASEPLSLERDQETGRVIIHRDVEERFFRDLREFNKSIDSLTVDIISDIDSNFVFKLSKRMMLDVLEIFRAPRNVSWIKKVLLTRERIDSGIPLRRAEDPSSPSGAGERQRVRRGREMAAGNEHVAGPVQPLITIDRSRQLRTDVYAPITQDLQIRHTPSFATYPSRNHYPLVSLNLRYTSSAARLDRYPDNIMQIDIGRESASAFPNGQTICAPCAQSGLDYISIRHYPSTPQL